MVTGLASHTHSLEDTRGVGRCADRTRSAETVVLTVSEISNTAETVSLDYALETFTFRGSYNVNKFAFLEDIHCKDFTVFLLVALLEAGELGKIAFRCGTCFCKMAFHRLGGMRFLFLTKSQLNGFITILLDGSHLCHDTRTSFNNCARYLLTVGIKKTGHSDFFS